MPSQEKILIILRRFKEHRLNQSNAPMLIKLLFVELTDMDWLENSIIGICKYLSQIGFAEIINEEYIRITDKGLDSIKHLSRI